MKASITSTVGILKPISGGQKIVILPTLGTKQIVGKEKSLATPVGVFEMTEDGDFGKIFGGFDQNLERLCLIDEQIRAFVENHRNWLSKNGWTFFLFKKGKGFSVKGVGLFSVLGLRVRVGRFSSKEVLLAANEHRIVVPQLESWIL